MYNNPVRFYAILAPEFAPITGGNDMKFMKTCCAFALAFCLILGLCANGLTAFAVDTDQQVNDIVDRLFGEDVTTEEAFNELMARVEEMENYENKPFYYDPQDDSFLLAFGDDVTVKPRRNDGYVEKLASALGVDFKNLSTNGMQIQDVYAQIESNSALVMKADLITLNFSNYTSTARMLKSLGGEDVGENDWASLVGEENVPKVEELLDYMYQELLAGGVNLDANEYDMESALECYTYSYMSNLIHQSKVIEAIRLMNTDAVIVLIGTYNNLENVVLDINGTTVDMGSFMADLVAAANLVGVYNADTYENVAYVDAPAVETTLDLKIADGTTDSWDYTNYIMLISSMTVPTENGHTYIKDQILNAKTDQPIVEPEPGPTPVTVLLGDLNNDGRVNSSDLNMLYRYNQEDLDLSAEQLKCADINQDGRVNSSDLNMLYRYNQEDETLTWEPVEIVISAE